MCNDPSREAIEQPLAVKGSSPRRIEYGLLASQTRAPAFDGISSHATSVGLTRELYDVKGSLSIVRTREDLHTKGSNSQLDKRSSTKKFKKIPPFANRWHFCKSALVSCLTAI
jgi:hypothetical protein